jgi:hypothetical protein
MIQLTQDLNNKEDLNPTQNKEDKCSYFSCLLKVQTSIEFILKQKIEYYKQNDNTTKHVHEMRYWNILKGLTLWAKL